jgi:hypothetical protein
MWCWFLLDCTRCALPKVYTIYCLSHLYNILATAYLIPNARRVRRHNLPRSFFYYIVKHPETGGNLSSSRFGGNSSMVYVTCRSTFDRPCLSADLWGRAGNCVLNKADTIRSGAVALHSRILCLSSHFTHKPSYLLQAFSGYHSRIIFKIFGLSIPTAATN